MYHTDGFEWVYIELHDCRVFSKTNRENYIQKGWLIELKKNKVLISNH